MRHTVQFFDILDTLGSAVAQFVDDSVASGRTVVLVARPTTLTAVTQALAGRGVSLDDLARSGRVVIRDAGGLLRSFMGTRLPMADRFEATVAAAVRELAADHPDGLAVYGEMVDILASEGNFDGAEALEQLGNELGRDGSFTLLCGYSAAHFAATPGAQAHLSRVCDLHSDVKQDQADLLANWLLGTVRTAS